MSVYRGPTTSTANRVVLNIYDINENNNLLYPLGLGFYHSGVQVGGREYTFANGSGIFCHDPKDAPGAVFRESVDYGAFEGTTKQLDDILSELRSQFQGDSYHIMMKNCNSFSDALLVQIVHKNIPGVMCYRS